MKQITDCLIIDTGAVKSPIAKLADRLKFAEGTQFLPTHPMAGRERAGFQNSASGLFVDHVWYLDGEVKLSEANCSRLDWMISRLRATPVFIGSADHDLLVSEISHLPQLISTILGGQVDPKMIKLAGPGLRSMLRLAGSPYSVWSEIIDENRTDIVESLELFADNLQIVIKKVKKKQSLDKIFSAAARSYKCLS
jgi:prephenate dehydrogenase